MPQATFTFPNGFLWGTATAAHQVEGSNTNNNWYAWEQQPGHIRGGDTSGRACDWWGGRWRDDLDRAAEAGQNAHRLSIEWSRVQPAPERWNEDALDVYREILRGMSQRGLMPMITLHHFTDPLWLSERGGWENPQTPALFEAYTRRVVEALGSFTNYWVPINEPNVYTYSGYMDGVFPPGKRDSSAAFAVMANMVRGHALAYRAIKSIQREARVGTAQHIRGMRPARGWSFPDRVLARLFSHNFNAAFLDALSDGRFRFLFKSQRIPEAAGTMDFTGLNYYTSDRVRFNPFKARDLFADRYYHEQALLSGTGFIANEPEGLFETVRWARRYDRPIMITENGVEDANDSMRPRYLVEHLHQLWRTFTYGGQVKGYFHWSLVDNFEWERGWSQRFGLWGLDPETQARTRRPSVDLYAAICRENALSYETVAKYAPDSLERIFPG